MRLQPLHRQLLVRPNAEGDVSAGGLLIPETVTSKVPYRFGEVLAVGTGSVNGQGQTVPCICQVGDVVAYARNAGLEIPVDAMVQLLIDERYILARVHDLPVASVLSGVDGRLLAMEPRSHAKADSVYKNIDELDRQAKDWPGFGDNRDHQDEDDEGNVH